MWKPLRVNGITKCTRIKPLKFLILLGNYQSHENATFYYLNTALEPSIGYGSSERDVKNIKLKCGCQIRE